MDKHFLSEKEVSGKQVFVGQISNENQKKIDDLRISDSKYKNLDDSVLFAIYVSRSAVNKANWTPQQ